MMDFVLQSWTGGLIQLAKYKWMLGAGRPWKPGERLSLLFTGYMGARNTGSDLRVEEMLRQVRQVLGADRIRLTVTTMNPEWSRGYFGDAAQLRMPDLFPPFLYREVQKHHGVIACEGSMFKSKFANALTTMMIGSLGLAAAQNKLSLGYGGDADQMDPSLAKMCRRYCSQSLVIPRNTESQAMLSGLGVCTELGTDTAWTFDPPDSGFGKKALREAGWDGTTPVLIVCPINPFFWPVRASVAKLAALKLTGANKASHYRGPYFHNAGPEVDRNFKHYVSAFAGAIKSFRRKHEVFPVIIGTERLDEDACRRVAEQIGRAPVYTSREHDMYEIVSLLRSGNLLVSSRYHGIVMSMAAGVASAGVSMDERIRNLMRERGQEHLLLTVDDPDLEPKLAAAMETLWKERDAVQDGIGRTLVRNLKLMARMGVYLEQEVNRRYPEFPVRTDVHGWQEYLPPLSANLRKLVEQYESAAEPMSQHAEA